MFKKIMLISGGLLILTTSVEKPSQAQSSVKWVVVPGGLAREDCIHTVPNGADIDVAGGNVIQNGAIIAHYDQCPEPAIMRGSQTPMPESAGIPNSNGWVEVANDHMDLASGSNITELFGDWTVPAIPSNNEGQTLYIWNGIGDDSQLALLQPVLQFGSSKAGTPCNNCWAIASWALFPDGTVWNTGIEDVSSGDTIIGFTNATQSGGTLNWEVEAYDWTSGVWTELTFGTTGYQWSWAWGAVLEADGVNTCLDFPSDMNGLTVFSNTAITNNGGQSTGWASSICANSSTCQPECSSNCFDYHGPNCGWGVPVWNASTVGLAY